RLRQVVEEHLDVGAAGRALPSRNFQVGTEDATPPGIVGALLRPIDLFVPRIDRQPNAPSRLVAAVSLATTGFNQRFNLRTIEIGAHDAHTLAIAPIELAALLIENDLLRRVSDSLRDDHLAVLAVDVGALDGTVVQVGNTHVGPVDMAR